MKHSRILWGTLLAVTLLGGCFGRKKASPAAGTSAEPDKVLYDRATNDIKHSRYTIGRLALQTLINTYPDSEYLAKAKLAIADSYYKEGGMAGLKQSISEYKDFITFFPFLDEAAYAQLQVAMAHYRQMEKADRDHSEAVDAEAELQTFLEKYPNSPLYPQAEQRLRETQEVLAEGDFGVARFYFIRGAYRAAGARLLELTTRYPLYSQADKANWMLGQIYEKGERSDLAARYYGRIVKDYPLSPLVADAKAKLSKFSLPIPQPDPTAMARMQKEQQTPRGRPGLIRRSTGFMKRGPDVSTAARVGAPTMTPSGESGDETLNLGPPPKLNIGGPAVGNTATVETVTPGTSSSSTQPAADATATPASSSDSATDPPANNASSASTDANSAQQGQPATTAQPADKSQESSSTKKKKGVRKIIPF